MAEKKYLSWEGVKVLVDKIKELIPAPYVPTNLIKDKKDSITAEEIAAYDTFDTYDEAPEGVMVMGEIAEGDENPVSGGQVYTVTTAHPTVTVTPVSGVTISNFSMRCTGKWLHLCGQLKKADGFTSGAWTDVFTVTGVTIVSTSGWCPIVTGSTGHAGVIELATAGVGRLFIPSSAGSPTDLSINIWVEVEA